MILVDLNQVMISNIMMQPGLSKNVDENLIRHMVVNSLRGYNVKFKQKYGDIVICSDDKNYWRREVFPYYKASRKKDREASPYNWALIFEVLHKIKDELKENFPYVVLQTSGAEADDIIGAICNKYGKTLRTPETENILILSSDKDFMQLQRYVNVEQFSPMAKKFIKPECNAKMFLLEHIIRGDRGDGIPNILSSDDTFVTEARQRPINKKKLNIWLDQDPEEFCNTDMLRNFSRNSMLIDLTKIPQTLQSQIIEQFESTEKRDRSKLFNYFMKHKMKQLMEHLQEF